MLRHEELKSTRFVYEFTILELKKKLKVNIQKNVYEHFTLEFIQNIQTILDAVPYKYVCNFQFV